MLLKEQVMHGVRCCEIWPTRNTNQPANRLPSLMKLIPTNSVHRILARDKLQPYRLTLYHSQYSFNAHYIHTYIHVQTLQ